MNYGVKVNIKLGRKYNNAKVILRNVTEIHYNFPSLIKQCAFESSIHLTGLNYFIDDILEFETETETKKEKEF